MKKTIIDEDGFIEKVESYDKTLYERGHMIDYCKCGHSNSFHFAEFILAETTIEEWLEKDKRFPCYRCYLEGKICVNFR